MHSFNYFFAISMSTTSPLSGGDCKAQWTKVSKKPFCCQNGSDWRWRKGSETIKSTCFPFRNKNLKHISMFLPQLSASGEKKIQERVARCRDNGRVATEEAGWRRVVFGGVFVFHAERWLTADGLLCGWSRVKETERFPPPESLHPPLHITILILRRGSNLVMQALGLKLFHTPEH